MLVSFRPSILMNDLLVNDTCCSSCSNCGSHQLRTSVHQDFVKRFQTSFHLYSPGKQSNFHSALKISRTIAKRDNFHTKQSKYRPWPNICRRELCSGLHQNEAGWATGPAKALGDGQQPSQLGLRPGYSMQWKSKPQPFQSFIFVKRHFHSFQWLLCQISYT